MATLTASELRTMASWVDPAALASKLTPGQLAVIAAELAKLTPPRASTGGCGAKVTGSFDTGALVDDNLALIGCRNRTYEHHTSCEVAAIPLA